MAPRFVAIADPLGDGAKFLSSSTGEVLASLASSLPSNATSRASAGVARAIEALLSTEAKELFASVPWPRGAAAGLLVAGTLLALLRAALLTSRTAAILSAQGKTTKLQKTS